MTSRAGAKTHSLRLWATAFGLGVLTLNFATGAIAGTKHHHHHHHDSGSDDESSARREARLHRLALKEKAVWRRHLAKVRHLSRDERIALRHHEHRARLRAMLAEEEAIDARRLRRMHADDSSDDPKPRHSRHHSADEGDTPKPRHRRHSDAADAAPTRHRKHADGASDGGSAHARRLAAHNARLAAHNARLEKKLAAHKAHLAKIEAAHKARVAKLQAAHEARLAARAKLIAAAALRHNERAAKQLAAKAQHAAQGSNYVALHGDDSAGHAITFWQTVAANVPVKVITVDLNDRNVKVSAVMSRYGDGTSEPFKQMIQRANPNVAVTGTFFSLDNMKPVGDIVIDGSLVHFGGMGTALCVTPNNRADMVTVEWGRHHDWTAYDFVCACGPRLLHTGRVVLDPHAERFKDRHMLSPNSRIAVGITRGNKLVFAMTREPIYLGRLAKVMQNLGCSEAMNLDAGTSTGFYYNGTTLARPGRKLTNMIVVYGRKDRYERALDQLVPSTYRRMDRTAHRLSKADTASPSRLAANDVSKQK